ncbi:glycoside hydrolase superfamily [Xylariaceae sp. FL0594]|nr:glycoside hydrolase superfamily [Xylariaceae sp. FL0594]
MRLFAISLALLSALQLSLGQPRHHHGGHRHWANREVTKKRDILTISDASLAEQTELPEVVVYVDQYGNPIRTATETVVYIPKGTLTPAIKSAPSQASSDLPPPPPAPPAAPAVPPSAVAAPPPPAPPAPPTPQAPPPVTPQPVPALATTTLPASSESTTVSVTVPIPDVSLQPAPVAAASGLHGVTYSPYRGDGQCKTADEVDRDFSLFAKDYGVVRIYGVDCDQVATVSKAARKYGNKLLVGIFDIHVIDSAVATMAAGLDHDWSVVDTVSVGNELVNNGGATVDQSLGALAEARASLRAAGYQGPVVIVDTFVAVLAHPELCDQSDYCAVNIHPFFDGNTGPTEAGSFVSSIVQDIRKKLSDPSKRIVVTETGWPWQGTANGAAVPGLDHQATALSSIRSAFSSNVGDVFLFTAFNDLWKKPDPGTFMAEQFWGMGGRYSPSDKWS